MVNPNPPVAAPEAPAAAPSTPASSEAADLASEIATVSDPRARAALEAAYGNLDAAPAEPVEPATPTEEPAATPAAPEPVPAAEPDDDGDEEPAEQADDEPKLSRRQRAEQQRQSEVEAAVKAALDARDAQQRAEQALAAREAESARLLETVTALIGDTNAENALIDQIATGDFEAADKLKALRTNRQQQAVLLEWSRHQVYADLMGKIQGVKSFDGVDPAVIDGLTDLSVAFEHVRDVTVKAEAAKWQAKLDRQKADYESRLGRAAAAMPVTETGGRAVGLPPGPTLADIRAMLGRKDGWKEFDKLSPEIMAAYQRGELR